MRLYLQGFLILASAVACLAGPARAGSEDPALQAKLDTRLQLVKTWAASPTIVAAVKALNARVPPEYAGMTEDRWTSMSVLDPFVRSFTRNDAATYLKTAKTDDVSEAFVSAANGMKVAFLAKTTNWSHKGKPKHDLPMSGRSWQGQIENDKSSGLEQIQLSVPVLDGGNPIGSLVVGFAVSKLR